MTKFTQDTIAPRKKNSKCYRRTCRDRATRMRASSANGKSCWTRRVTFKKPFFKLKWLLSWAASYFYNENSKPHRGVVKAVYPSGSPRFLSFSVFVLASNNVFPAGSRRARGHRRIRWEEQEIDENDGLELRCGLIVKYYPLIHTI